MSSESIEVQMARLDERLKTIIGNQAQERTARKEQYEKIEVHGRAIDALNTNVAALNEKLDGQAPTIEEFITIKHKVVGAGRFGRWLWAFGAGLLGAVAYFREAIGLFLIGDK